MTESGFSISQRPFLRATIACQYFLYFGVMGIYLPYFNLYCYHLGFSGFDIGVLSALRSIALVVFPMAWGALADHVNARRPIYILCNVVSAGIWALFLTTEAFMPMAVILFFYGIFYAPIISFLEAISMESLGREKQSYGKIRLWGSISFITMVLAFGSLIGIFSERVIIISIWIGSILLAVTSSLVPRDRPGGTPLSLRDAKALLQWEPAVFLFCAFLMLAGHGAYYGFFSIHLATLGYSGAFIGAAWALASSAEIVAMLYSDAIFKRFALERVLLASFVAALLRWWMLGSSASAAVILLSQVLHAMTYGTFHMASILYMDRRAPSGAKNLGQALNNALTYGLGLMTGFFVNGYLYEKIGSFGIFYASSLIALAGGLLFGAFHLWRRRSADA
jgi:PPP family 3-phenylpropionic acid transporter